MPPVLRHFYARQSLQNAEISASDPDEARMAKLAATADLAAESWECCLALHP